MIEQNELVTLLVAIAVLLFVVTNRDALKGLPRARICMSSFLCLVMGLTFTVLEGLFWAAVFNFLEHACYFASSIFLAGWVWLVFVRAEPWPET